VARVATAAIAAGMVAATVTAAPGGMAVVKAAADAIGARVTIADRERIEVPEAKDAATADHAASAKAAAKADGTKAPRPSSPRRS
jgi:hypothetical protein